MEWLHKLDSLSKYKLTEIWFKFFFFFLNITGYKIKKGWSVNLDVVSIHHDPEVLPDPQKFDPSRFDVSSSHLINQ